jgi:uncharacterized membrane protein YhaH (DUF805 family)/uncharacterized membrane protein YeaQ/YmgE (transglycosylase-associated protein family)
MGILAWIVLGLLVGVLARFIMPGTQAMGIIGTIIIGIVGAVVGGGVGIQMVASDWPSVAGSWCFSLLAFFKRDHQVDKTLHWQKAGSPLIKQWTGRKKMNWYLEVLKKYAVFGGRARRKEYWYFVLFNIIIIIVLTFIDVMTGTYNQQANIGLLSGIYILVVLIPGIGVAVRRLHDTDRSGWWLLIGLIPLIGGIVLLVFMLQDSKPGANQYGSNPKEATA